MALRMLERGKYTNEEIAENLELPLDVIKKLAENTERRKHYKDKR